MHPSISSMLETLCETAEIRRACTAIQKSFDGRAARSIVVTSAVAAEGKTLATAGMAMVAAAQGKRVLVVDLNWFRPVLHRVFERAPNFDTQRLEHGNIIPDLVQETSTDHLEILPAPEDIPETAYAGSRLNLLAEKIIQQAREHYDITFIDTAGLYPTNRHMMDPAVFSWNADGVVLVVLANHTSRKTVKRALITLQTSGANLLGVVANKWNKE